MLNDLVYELDGKENGICLVKEDSRLLRLGNKNRFKNMDLFDEAIEHFGINIEDYEFGIVVGNEFVPWSKLTEREGWYEAFGGPTDDIYFTIFKPHQTREVVKTGYFCFGEDYREFLYNFEKGTALSKMNFKALSNAFAKLFRAGEIKGVHYSSDGYTTYSFFGTTYTINIMPNYRMIKFNEIRKELGIGRTIPFIKDIDKYKTVFWFITRDSEDPQQYYNNKFADIFTKVCKDASKKLDGINISLENTGNIYPIEL